MEIARSAGCEDRRRPSPGSTRHKGYVEKKKAKKAAGPEGSFHSRWAGPIAQPVSLGGKESSIDVVLFGEQENPFGGIVSPQKSPIAYLYGGWAPKVYHKLP